MCVCVCVCYNFCRNMKIAYMRVVMCYIIPILNLIRNI